MLGWFLYLAIAFSIGSFALLAFIKKLQSVTKIVGTAAI